MLSYARKLQTNRKTERGYDMEKRTRRSYNFYNLEQVLFQCAEFYGAGMPDYDEKARETVNAILDKIDIPFFNPCWRENAERLAADMTGFDLLDAASVAGDCFTECHNGKFPDKRFLPWDMSDVDETTVFQSFVHMLAGIRSQIPAIA